ncbi:hypothetical protein GW17_00040920 [Ensete ventricosum]|nr:hypothetical protein GW17_00040920 [Ensete ventricosum]
MCSAQRLGWLNKSYGSTLATKLDGAQGKVGRLVKDETVQNGRYCVTTERVKQSSQTVRGIANSKDSVLIQGLVHGRRSVRGYPKVRSELSAMEHQNFLFDMERLQIVLVGNIGPGFRQWCTNSSERRVCASELALDESLSHQHMGAVYHQGRSPSACTSESHGGRRNQVNDQELLEAPLR